MGWKAVTSTLVALGLPLALAACSGGNKAEAPLAPAAHEQRFGAASEITPDNVSELGLAWYHQFETDRGQQAIPVVRDGVLYTVTDWSIAFAFDAKTGEKLWSFDPQVSHDRMATACCDAVSRGLAVDKGKVFLAAYDGRVIALDAKSGKQLWSEQSFIDTSKPYSITGAPRIAGNRVIIGNGGAELGVRGYITAFDTETGKKAWRFFTVPNPTGKPDGEISDRVLAEKVDASWSEGAWKVTGGGGTVWDGMAYDPETDLFYFGVGNGNPHNYQIRSGGKGDNLFLSSIVAVKGSTGEYVWHYQQTPGETWDYTATQPIMLADLTIGGKPRKVIMQAPKNGFFYVLDRTTGELLSADPFTAVNWAKGVDLKTGKPIEVPEARMPKGYFDMIPGPLGGHGAQNWSYSPGTGLVYIPAQHMMHRYAIGKWTYRPGHFNIGYDLSSAAQATPEALTKARENVWGELVAWDPVARKARWKVKHKWFYNGGTLATGGNVVFQGSSDGTFNAYDATNGKKLWSYSAGNGIIAAPVSYEIKGTQYIAIMVGYGGPSAFVGGLTPLQPRRPGRLLVFALDGKAQAPAYSAEVRAPPLDASVTSKGDVKAGAVSFAQNCVPCHGPAALSRYQADLLRSGFMTSPAALHGVLANGTEKHRGMPPFTGVLSATEIENIRAYIIDRARKEKPGDGM